MISNGDVERSHEASGPEQRFRGIQAAPSRPEQQFRAPQVAPSWPEKRFRALQGAPSRPEQRFRAPQAAISSATGDFDRQYGVFKSFRAKAPPGLRTLAR